ncbi:MAG TPA: GNAT family protein [Anaerolineales bacterium]|jgi:ribosomal-protein-serine acetyltransferase|nr:GNAT family protein [Anaerolineales bacterium]HQX17687.1 GNAT family protein [Anaerolineales bacterium]
MFSHKIDDDITLRLLEERHAEEVFSLLEKNRNHLQDELTWLTDQLSVNDAKEYIKAGLERFAANNGLRAGVWLQDNLAGIVSVHGLVWDDRKASLGYWLGSSFQGRGLVTKSCSSLIAYAFSKLKLNRLEIQCDSENDRSRKVAERLGFTQEGILRQSWWSKERFADLVVYGLLSSEWQGGKPYTPLFT